MRVIKSEMMPALANPAESGKENCSQNADPETPSMEGPQPVKPPLIPQISFTLFASPEAQKAMRVLNGDEDEEEKEEEGKEKEGESGEDVDRKETVDDEELNADSSGESSEGTGSKRYQWRVVARTVAGYPRSLKTNSNSLEKLTSLCPDIPEQRSSRVAARRASTCVVQGRTSFSPCPPRSPRVRRMSLSPCRRPLLPPRNGSTHPFPPSMQKTMSNSSLDSESSQELNFNNASSTSTPTSSSPTSRLGLPVDSSIPSHRALSRRRMSLPVSPRTHLIPPRPPSPFHQARSSSTGCDGQSSGRVSPMPSVVNSCSSTSIASGPVRRTAATSTLAANREKLESLMKERSRVIANLTIGGSSQSSQTKSQATKETASPKMSPKVSPKASPTSPIRANHSLRKTALSVRSASMDTDSDHSDVSETITLLGGECPGTSLPVNTVSDVTSMHSEPAGVTRSLDDACLRQVGGRPIFRRKGSNSFDSGISVSDASVVSDSLEVQTVCGEFAEDISRTSRLRRRRGTICVGSLSSLLVPISGQGRRPSVSMSSPLPPDPSSVVVERSHDEIEQDVEEELQQRILTRKSQLLMHSVPGSSSAASALANLEARAISKTTNGRLKKICGNLTEERTTAELLDMKAAMVAAARREHLQKSKSFEV